jgi:TRAP-type C4-dicarboxylate transport system permease small subunit
VSPTFAPPGQPAMDILERISQTLNGIMKYVAAFLLAAMTILVFLQVVFRYLLALPLAWSEETASFSFVWMSLLGASIALRHGDHPSLDVLFRYFPAPVKKWVQVLIYCTILFVLTVLLIYGFRLAVMMKGQVTAALHYSVAYMYAVLPLSALVMLVHTVALTVKTVLRGVEDKG